MALGRAAAAAGSRHCCCCHRRADSSRRFSTAILPRKPLADACSQFYGSAVSVDARAASTLPPARKRVLSGIQPTGALHLGNYFGALRTWVTHQDDYDNYFCVVDLHALTTPVGHDPKALAAQTRQTVATYVACGIDPEASVVFVQSHVRQHAELQWLLSCATPLGWLTRMTQYKDKAGAGGTSALLGGSAESDQVSVGTGLLTYPVLMAADILLYRAALVPVGEDQYQHVELTRDIARSFNKRYKKAFRIPAVLPADRSAVRVMSLTDGRAKMSKSAPAENSRINLLDTPDEIAKKVKKAKTDAVPGGVTAELEILTVEAYGGGSADRDCESERWDHSKRPEAANLLGLYGLATGSTPSQVAAELEGLSWGQFKPMLVDALVEVLNPVREEHGRLMAESGHLDKIISVGAERAGAVAEATLQDVKSALGMLQP